MCFYFGTLLIGKGNLMPSLCFLRNEISRIENGKSSTYQDCHNMQSFVWNYLLLVSQRWGNISFLSCWSSDLEAFLSYYYSRNIVRRTNYCMEKMTGWVKMLWGSMFCRVCVTIQYFFFSPSYLYNFGFAFGLLWIHNLSMNSYFIFPVICEVLYFGFWSYSSVFMWSFLKNTIVFISITIKPLFVRSPLTWNLKIFIRNGLRFVLKPFGKSKLCT